MVRIVRTPKLPKDRVIPIRPLLVGVIASSILKSVGGDLRV